jgi:hypothetical protein
MNAIATRTPDLFDAVEKDILRRYFGLKPRLADHEILEAALPDDDEPAEDGGDDACDDAELDGARRRDAQRGVRMRDVHSLDVEDLALSDAVARICLNAIRGRLPNWSTVTDEGFVTARRRERKRAAQVPLLPRFLFSIDWAMSAPGYSWPEVYHATFIPGFDRWIVTASLDGTDTWGVSDLALGSFRAREDFEQGCADAITFHWALQRRTGQEAWQLFDEAGTISRKTAMAWRREIWGKAA